AASQGVRMYVPSCSSRTVVYKGLMAGTRLADFYLDLKDERCESKLAVFHQRYSTNTMPDWRLAQPFRMLAHNGEINTVTGNRAWMRAREAELEPELRGAMGPEEVVERGRLGPGQMLLVDTRDGSLLRDSDAKERAAARHGYALLADRVLVPVERHHVDLDPLDDLPAHHALHGWGTEDVKFVVEVMAETGAEPVYSMGD